MSRWGLGLTYGESAISEEEFNRDMWPAHTYFAKNKKEKKKNPEAVEMSKYLEQRYDQIVAQYDYTKFIPAFRLWQRRGKNFGNHPRAACLQMQMTRLTQDIPSFLPAS